MHNISYSQLSMWLNCPKQWKYRYYDGVPKDTSIELVFGTAIHNTIQDWAVAYYANKTYNYDQSFQNHFLKEFSDAITIVDDKKIPVCDKKIFKEYYNDGVEILSYIKKHITTFFNKNLKLVGVEVPLDYDISNSIHFIGYIDIVFYDETEKQYHIWDFKTSKNGWSDYQKKDKKKLAQLLLYKTFFSKVFDVDVKNITVKFIILKRKLQQESIFPQKQIIEFVPSQGSPSLKEAYSKLNDFINIGFDTEGNIQVNDVVATPSKSACMFCQMKLLCEDSYFNTQK